jgi:hypothetical protein
VCDAGRATAKPVLAMRAAPFSLKLSGEAVIPKPWTGVDPLVNGIRVVVEDAAGVRFDATVPGGAGWSRNAAGTRWIYKDLAGSAGGVTRVMLRDRSGTTDGLLAWRVVAKGTSSVLPGVASTRAAVVLGAAAECAAAAWNGPTGVRPRCAGDASRINCR